MDSYQAGFERLSPSEKAGRVIVARGETAHQFAIMDDTVAGILFAKGNQRLPRYPLLPAGLVGRLAVDEGFRGRGLGGALVVDAIARAARAEPAIFSLVVNAKDDTAAGFYTHHGFRRFASQPMTLYLPIAEAARHLAGVHS